MFFLEAAIRGTENRLEKRIDNEHLQAGRSVEELLHLAYCQNGSALDLIKKTVG